MKYNLNNKYQHHLYNNHNNLHKNKIIIIIHKLYMIDYIKMHIIKNLKNNYNYQKINLVVKL